MDQLDKTIEDLIRLFINDKASNMEIEHLGKDHNDSAGDASFFGEQQECNKLSVINNCLSLADCSIPLPILTVTRKFGYKCMYIFHIIYPEEFIWRLIISQTQTTFQLF